MEPIFLSLFANIIRMYAIYRCMEHFFLSKDENKISKICMYTGFVLVNSVGYYLFNNMVLCQDLVQVKMRFSSSQPASCNSSC